MNRQGNVFYKDKLCGIIAETDEGYTFEYTDSWLSQKDAQPISQTMPNLSDNGYEHISWFGSSIYKAMRICKECARPFYVGVSGAIYHSLNEDLRIAQRRILGIKKNVEMWTKVTYQYENVKKHLYQTNHKISPEEA